MFLYLHRSALFFCLFSFLFLGCGQESVSPSTVDEPEYVNSFFLGDPVVESSSFRVIESFTVAVDYSSQSGLQTRLLMPDVSKSSVFLASAVSELDVESSISFESMSGEVALADGNIDVNLSFNSPVPNKVYSVLVSASPLINEMDSVLPLFYTLNPEPNSVTKLSTQPQSIYRAQQHSDLGWTDYVYKELDLFLAADLNGTLSGSYTGTIKFEFVEFENEKAYDFTLLEALENSLPDNSTLEDAKSLDRLTFSFTTAPSGTVDFSGIKTFDLNKLKDVQVLGGDYSEADGLHYIFNFAELTKFRIAWSKVSSDLFDRIGQERSLKELDFQDVHDWTGADTLDLSKLSGLINLERFYLSANHLDYSNFETLALFTKLSKLELFNSRFFSDIPDLPSVSELIFSASGSANDDELTTELFSEFLMRFSNLERLTLELSGFEDELSFLEEASTVRFLNIKRFSVQLDYSILEDLPNLESFFFTIGEFDTIEDYNALNVPEYLDFELFQRLKDKGVRIGISYYIASGEERGWHDL